MEIIEVTINNFNEYQHRRDQKACSWFRLENRFWRDQKLWGMDASQKITWIALLSIASESNSENFVLNLNYMVHEIGISKKKLIETMEKYQELRMLTITRNVHVTSTDHSRSATDKQTNKQTDQKDVCCVEQLAGESEVEDVFKKVKIDTQKRWLKLYDPEWMKTEVLKMLNWIESNPRRRPRKWAAFMSNWFDRGWENYRKKIPTNKSGQEIKAPSFEELQAEESSNGS